MSHQEAPDPRSFQFRGLHPKVFLGTASDRYAGWIGQIYSEKRFAHRISRRTVRVGGKSFVEEVLPVESVEEYFKHFSLLELDFTFYRPLLDRDGNPTSTYQVLKTYRQHLRQGDHLILKVPQAISAQKLWRGGAFIENEAYLNAGIFKRQFYEPVVDLLGPSLQGLIFEQEYQRKKDRSPSKDLAEKLEAFFREIPKDNRYHVELRTEEYLRKPVFDVCKNHGVGQVLSHWTWLPSLSKQFAESGRQFFNSGKQCIVRLMTPRGMRYADAYAQAHPFSAMVDGMLQPAMVEQTVELMLSAINQGISISVIINNRAGGNAPLVAQQLAERFLERGT